MNVSKTMNDRDIQDVEIALDSLRRNKKAQFHLRRFLGKETRYEEINGHLFDLNEDPGAEGTEGWCVVSTCEMSSPEHAELSECPASLEGYDMYVTSDDGF